MLTVEKLVEDLKMLSLVTSCSLEKEIKISEFSRPGLELTGYVEYYPKLRVQVFGMNEYSYLEKQNFCDDLLDKFLDKDVPVIIFCRGLVPPKNFIDLANKRNIPVCTTSMFTSKFCSKIYEYLEHELAPVTQVHGVMVSVFGKGILIKGGSGIGKSEIALELINRGHILVADDAVVLKRVDDDVLLGSAPPLLKNRIEIRGVGILDIQKLYGVTKVMKTQRLDLVIELNKMTGMEDRIGNQIKSECILDCEVPKIEIPITVGRSISNLIEVAVANFDLRVEYGYNSSEEFIKDLDEHLRSVNNGSNSN